MKSEVSSNYLYHFTSKLDTIISILKDSAFKPFYCLERLDYLSPPNEKGTFHEMAFPMVCFCDLPEDKQVNHRERFGVYSISLFKEWGFKRVLTPVTYCSERTLSALALKILIQHSDEIKNDISYNQSNKLRNSLSILLMHYKSYEGFEYNKNLKTFELEKKRFYDERERRYLPIEIDKLNWNLTRIQFENPEFLRRENLKIQESNSLRFDLSDIFKIQVKEEKEINSLLKNLSNEYRKEELQILKKKIVVNENPI